MNANLLAKASDVVLDPLLLVNMVRLRVRQLVLGHRPLVEVPPGRGLADVALSEIAAGKIVSESTINPPDANLPPIAASSKTAAVKLAAWLMQSPTSAGMPSPGPGEARAYLRAHAGKLMVALPKETRNLESGDFFQLSDVGTHPDGLIVTGIFAGERRSHLMASVVRAATAAEVSLAQELERQEARKAR